MAMNGAYKKLLYIIVQTDCQQLLSNWKTMYLIYNLKG